MILSLTCPKCGRPLELTLPDTSEANALALARLILCQTCDPDPAGLRAPGRPCDALAPRCNALAAGQTAEKGRP
jgi:hypothetical protein